MNDKPYLKWFFWGAASLFLLGGLFLYQVVSFSDDKLHLVFCDVGQGDAIFIRTPKGVDILIDGGPNDSVLSCLSRHMPFWDRSIEVILLTHPHADHLNGLLSVLEQYTVDTFITEKLSNDTEGFRSLEALLAQKHIPVRLAYAPDVIRISDGVRLQIVGPTKAFLQNSSPNGTIAESNEFASLLTVVSFEEFDAFLTGDSQVGELLEASINLPIDVLQVPHHGSKTGLTNDVLIALMPKLAVISVGKKNRYSHPHPLVVTLLDKNNIPTLRTDRTGEIEIVSDGKTWQVIK